VLFVPHHLRHLPLPPSRLQSHTEHCRSRWHQPAGYSRRRSPAYVLPCTPPAPFNGWLM
jgi:hypothetical protein